MKTPFQCARCGNCCRWPGAVRVNDRETEAIAGFLGLSVLEFTDRYCCLTPDRQSLSLIENSEGHCIFFQNDPPACLIESVKPQQCRDFPDRWNFPGWEECCEGGKRSLS